MSNDEPTLQIRPCRVRMVAGGVVAGCILVLTCASLWVFSGAINEPFVSFRLHDALVQAGVGMAILALWLTLAVAVCVAVVRKLISRWWLLSLVWIAVACAVVAPCPLGYVSDVARYAIKSE